MSDAYVFGGTYRDDSTGRGRFRVVNPFLTVFWERDEPLRVFDEATLPGRRLDRCHLYRITDAFCRSVELVEENPEWTNRVGAPGLVFLAESEVVHLYRAYCLHVGRGDHG